MMEVKLPGGDIYTVSDAARLLGVSEQTLRNWDKRGKLKPSFVMARGIRLYSKELIDKFLEDKDTSVKAQ
jgi:excisionase family DNA binding protein